MIVTAWVDKHGRVRCGGKGGRCRWSFGDLVADLKLPDDGYAWLGAGGPIRITGVRLDSGWRLTASGAEPTPSARKLYERHPRDRRPFRLPDPAAKTVRERNAVGRNAVLKGEFLVSPTTVTCLDPRCGAVNRIDPDALAGKQTST